VAQTYEPAVILCPAQPTSAFSLHARPLYPPREDRFIAPFQGNLQSHHNGLPYQTQRHPALDAGSSYFNKARRCRISDRPDRKKSWFSFLEPLSYPITRKSGFCDKRMNRNVTRAQSFSTHPSIKKLNFVRLFSHLTSQEGSSLSHHNGLPYQTQRYPALLQVLLIITRSGDLSPNPLLRGDGFCSVQRKNQGCVRSGTDLRTGSHTLPCLFVGRSVTLSLG